MRDGDAGSGAEFRTVAVIPARGGSKGIPHKNTARIGGKPLIAWTIDAARRAPHIDRVIVSTDDDAITAIALECGAEVPFKRPEHLAQDSTPGVPPIIHALGWLADNEGYQPDGVLCLQPTSPLRSVDDIEAVVRVLSSGEADSVVSVVPSHHHPLWMKLIDGEGYMRDYTCTTSIPPRRQELPPVYALNGALYASLVPQFLQRESWYGERTLAYVMPQDRSLDIDSEWDIRVADLILQQMYGGSND